MSGSPRSEHFDDIYFAVENGLEETKHVFLAGNGLPERWSGRSRFTIAETGFGTGLNFIAAWQAFEQTSSPQQMLQYVSVEKYPLSRQQIQEYLSVWNAEIGEYLNRLVELYPLRVTGWHSIQVSSKVSLLLIFDDANRALPEITGAVDAWFLDGHAPAKNPDMWSDIVFSEIGRLSSPGATCATFTAAGIVKRGLASAGFKVDKARGYGRKRDMIIAHRVDTAIDTPIVKKSYAVVGGGLAGTAVAYSLQKRGRSVSLYEQNKIASGASGNPVGLFNPRFTAQKSADSDFYGSAYALAVRTFQEIQKSTDIDYRTCGSLHLMTDADKEKRFNAVSQNWGWHTEHLEIYSAAEASEASGIDVPYPCLYLPDSGTVSPEKLCQAYSSSVNIIYEGVDKIERQGDVWIVNGIPYDVVVLANGIECLAYEQTADLPLHTVRGQLTFAASEVQTKANLCYGGYCSVAQNGLTVIGSTFQPWLTTTEVRDEDHQRILDNLFAAVPQFAGKFTITGGRASLRTAAKDRTPIGGKVPGHDDLYISTAHGSHGLLSALMIGEYIASESAGEISILPKSVSEKISPTRFGGKA